MGSIISFTLIFVTLIGTPSVHNAVVYTFSGDESASFLALEEMIKKSPSIRHLIY